GSRSWATSPAPACTSRGVSTLRHDAGSTTRRRWWITRRSPRRSAAGAGEAGMTMSERVTFLSDDFRLAGVLGSPDGVTRGERRPAFMLLHGFGSTKDSGGMVAAATLLEGLGYATLRFDMRGCGESEGARGRVICLEQVADTRNALTFLAGRAGVDPERIG